MTHPSVEALQGAAMVRGKTAGIPFRQTCKPTPLCVVDPAAAALAANVIREAIRGIERSRGCGAYLFVNPSLQAFVISEERPAALDWVRDRFVWLVGFYCTRRSHDPKNPVLRPTVSGLREDLEDHLSQFDSATTGREYGGPQPAGRGNSRHPVNGLAGSAGAARRAPFVRESGEGSGHE